MSYQDTSLWKRTLGLYDSNVEPLRNSFLRAREHAEFLLGKIRNDFPNLTVHDITHVDSLWNVADTIIGPDYRINPLEGYILGIAFLIHDAALSYNTVGGIDKLRGSIQWKDAFADGPGDKNEEEFKKECDFDAIRALHAKYAEDIPTQVYKNDNGSTFYIIENDDYRTYFGELIGMIAASHHWSIDDVESKLEPQVNPIAEVPGDWEINAQKLACILRCADAGHIDNGRAPYNIYRSLNINGVSRYHWESQVRLGQVRPNKKDPGKLLITSIKSFSKNEFAAWNVAYEAVRIFDEELKKSNDLLKSIDEDLVFPFTGVSGANSKEELAEHIKTIGWQPCNFGVHTSNVKLLIENLGGSKLYGEKNKLLVVLRELIQNARDAIHAKQKLEESFDNGRIIIRFLVEDNQCFIEVEDNGIGMSLDCIKNHLLDFGSSYWKSSLSKNENEGLRSKGFKSIGQFGIGFYSVFMVANYVDVRTKRYDSGNSKARQVEFPEGLTLSPILSNCELESGVSTIIRIKLQDTIDEIASQSDLFSVIYDIMTHSELHSKEKIWISDVMPMLLSLISVGLDCDVYYGGSCVHKNVKSIGFNKKEWLSGLCINYSSTFARDIERIAETLDFIKDERGNIIGLITIDETQDVTSPKYDLPSFLTNGGLTADVYSYSVLGLSSLHSPYYGFIGYLDCNVSSITRDKVFIDEQSRNILQRWFDKKYIDNYDRILESSRLANNYERFASVIKLDITKLVQRNARVIYKNYLSDSRIAYCDDSEQLKGLYSRLYSGLHDDLIETSMVSDLTSSKLSYEDLISKFIYIIKANFFLYGRWGVASVWLNLKLYDYMQIFIDWKSVNRKEFGRIISNNDDKSSLQEMKVFLKQSFIDPCLLLKRRPNGINDYLILEDN